VTEYLELEDLLAAAEAAIGGPAEIRDVGLLQSAVERPRSTAIDRVWRGGIPGP